jgi:hypothetical protein
MPTDNVTKITNDSQLPEYPNAAGIGVDSALGKLKFKTGGTVHTVSTAGDGLPVTGGTLTGPLDILQDATGGKLILAMKLPGTTQDAPTTLGAASNYLQIGGGEWNQNSYRCVGFGYIGAAGNHHPAFVGYQETSISSNTHGDLVFGTRATNGNDVPPVVMRIRSDGQIMAENPAYTPSNDLSLIDLKYFNGNTLRSVTADVTLAEVNAGFNIPGTAFAGYRSRLIDVTIIAIGANAAGGNLVLNGTRTSVVTPLVTFAPAALVRSAITKPHSADVTPSADGAAYAPNDVNTAFRVTASAAITGPTAFRVVLSFALGV